MDYAIQWVVESLKCGNDPEEIIDLIQCELSQPYDVTAKYSYVWNEIRNLYHYETNQFMTPLDVTVNDLRAYVSSLEFKLLIRKYLFKKRLTISKQRYMMLRNLEIL